MSLRDFKGEKIAIWLAYFLADNRNHRRKIRKLSKKIDLNTLVSVCQKLGLNPIPFQDKIHPATGISGLVMVDKKYGKYNTIKRIMAELESQKN